jgi:hypothetical protein
LTTSTDNSKRALYFGYAPGGGHFLQCPNKPLSLAPERDVPGFPWNIGLLDCGLLKNGRHDDVYDGRVFWTCGGDPLWLAFVWWDRSGDKRGASNSGFYVQGFQLTDRQAAFDYASSIFPQVIARQTHPLVLEP